MITIHSLKQKGWLGLSHHQCIHTFICTYVRTYIRTSAVMSLFAIFSPMTRSLGESAKQPRYPSPTGGEGIARAYMSIESTPPQVLLPSPPHQMSQLPTPCLCMGQGGQETNKMVSRIQSRSRWRYIFPLRDRCFNDRSIQ